MAINIDILANTRQFQASVKDVDKALSDVSDTLDDLAKDSERSADRAGDALEDGFEDGAKSASKAVEKLERSFKDLSDAASRESRQAGDDIGDNIKRGTRKAEDGLEGFNSEANSTAREAAASFDGSAESIGDAFQEVAANAFAGFGPAGAVAGLAAAAGLGAVMSAFDAQAEAAERLKAQFASMYREAVEEGKNYLSEAQIIAEANNLMFDEDRQGEYNDALNDAKVLGLEINDVIRARAGDEEKLEMIRRHGAELEEEYAANLSEHKASEIAELANINKAYERIHAAQEEQQKRANRSIELERQMGSEERANTSRALGALDEKGRKLEEFYGKARNVPHPVITPEVNLGPAQWAIDRFTAGSKRLTIVADVVDRAGRRIQ